MSSSSRTSTAIYDEAQRFIKMTQKKLRRARGVNDDVRNAMQTHLNELRHLLEEDDASALEKKLKIAQSFAHEHFGIKLKSAWREYFESIALAILCALILRGFVIEAFKIPTGSMIPTLLVGDHLFVNKFVYGIRVPFTKHFLLQFSEPQRGEVVVFSFPTEQAREHIAQQSPARRDCIDRGSLEEEKDFIKRIVGVGGDRVEIRDNQLIVNDEPVPRTFLRKRATGYYLFPHEFHEQEELNGRTYTIKYSGGDESFGPVTVRDGHFFVIGDNRDNSSDSRCWGQIPVENLKGRAMFIWWSKGPEESRWDRIGKAIE